MTKQQQLQALAKKAWEFDHIAKDAVGSLRDKLKQAAEDMRQQFKKVAGV